MHLKQAVGPDGAGEGDTEIKSSVLMYLGFFKNGPKVYESRPLVQKRNGCAYETLSLPQGCLVSGETGPQKSPWPRPVRALRVWERGRGRVHRAGPGPVPG